MNKQKPAVSNAMSTLAEDARNLMTATADVAGEKVVEARKRLAITLERGKEIYGGVREKTVESTNAFGEPMVVAKAQVKHGVPLRTLLYVEDNPANLKLVEQLIARRPDIHLLSAVNGNLGIELARNNQPDVILMDINLPGITGIQALKILRRDPVTAHIPVIALSANAMPRDIKKGMEAGFLRYITKPIKINEFMNALDVALEFAEKGIAQNK